MSCLVLHPPGSVAISEPWAGCLNPQCTRHKWDVELQRSLFKPASRWLREPGKPTTANSSGSHLGPWGLGHVCRSSGSKTWIHRTLCAGRESERTHNACLAFWRPEPTRLRRDERASFVTS